MNENSEVLVIGGGPAGLAAAIAARMKGFEVTVADGGAPPIDKACGEGMMPGTVRVLRQLGVRISPQDGEILRGVCFQDDTTSVEAVYPDGTGLGIRRTLLHERMIERAEECGVRMLWSTAVTGLTQQGATLGKQTIGAKWIIGADGTHSSVRRWGGLDTKARPAVRFARRKHFRVKAWTDRMEIHWGQKAQAYVTPLGADETCVSLISRDPRMRLEDGLRIFPKLAGYLKHAEATSVERGAATVTRKLNQVYRGNVTLIGDASGSVDAITGEGLCLSFQQAIALAEALQAGNLEIYQKAHRQLGRRPRTMGHLLLLLDQYPSLRKRAFRGIAAERQLFARLLAAHLGEPSPISLAATTLRLGWQFLTA
jgi:flavin-dependent dehydrogenase